MFSYEYLAWYFGFVNRFRHGVAALALTTVSCSFTTDRRSTPRSQAGGLLALEPGHKARSKQGLRQRSLPRDSAFPVPPGKRPEEPQFHSVPEKSSFPLPSKE